MRENDSLTKGERMADAVRKNCNIGYPLKPCGWNTMINKALFRVTYGLRWLVWIFHYLVIWPVATLVLIVALLFCLDKTTPGMVAVDYLQKAGSITDGQRWTWRECAKQTAAELPPSSVYPGSPLQEACPEVVSDAQGYAAYIDRSLRELLTGLWVLMVLIYGVLAWFLGFRPYFPRYVFVKAAKGRGYIRCASSRPQRGMGNAVVFSVKKEPGRHQGCDVYASSLSSLSVNECDKWPENEGEKG